jgi:phosphoglycolate phosphatase
MRTVIFDLDGTLADTGDDLLAAANAVFEAGGHGRPLGPADRATAMRGGRAMLRLGAGRLGLTWDEAALAAGYARLLLAYEAAIAVHTRLFPGAAEAVAALRRGGIAVGICTNKPAFLAGRLLAELGVRDLFGSLVGGDTLSARKPDPAPLHLALRLAGGAGARGLMVGDTATDREAARNARIPAALVTFGAEAETVAGLAPEALIGHFDELPGVVARLLP